MRADEQFAIEAFVDRIRQLNPSGIVSWRPGDDPPDFDLRIGSTEYAVEVTRITDEIKLGDAIMAEGAVSAGLQHVTDELRAKATESGLISGAYLLQLVGIPNLKSHLPGALKRALDYMSKTAQKAAADEKIILEVEPVAWTIEKLHSKEAWIECMYMPSPGGAHGPEIRKKLKRWLHDRLLKKASQLAEIDRPKILILLDELMWRESAAWREGLPTDMLTIFHTIARVPGQNECQILHTMEPSWRAAVRQ